MVLAKGSALPIAKEGCLKIKEVTYIQAEAYMCAEMKHGPIALIDSNHPGKTKVLLCIFEDEHLKEMELALSEVKSRAAHTMVITDCLDLLDASKID